MSKVVATRIDPTYIAKSRDALIALGYPEKDLDSVSSILKITFFCGYKSLHNHENINTPPTPESVKIANNKKPHKINHSLD